MKKNKGFTLIELLTVIAILAIILLIAAPTILGVLDKAKKNNFKNQVLLYVEGLKQQVALTSLNQADMSITLPDVGSSTLVNIQDIPMDTSTSLKGSIRIENDNGSYKYYLVGVSNDDYKVKGEVEANSLTTGDIAKTNEKNSDSSLSISLDGVPATIDFEDSHVLPTSYLINGSSSGGNVVCKVGSTVVTNTNSLSPGTHTINCTVTSGAGKEKTVSKTITVKSPLIEGVLLVSTDLSVPHINGNNISMGGINITYKVYLDKIGYTFDYVLKPSNGSISFCDNNNSCETIVSQPGGGNTYTGSYTNTKAGYIKLSFSGCNMEINNIKYKGVPVVIKNEYPFDVIFYNNCTNNQAITSCSNKLQNNSIVTGNVYITSSHPGISKYAYIKINDGEWTKMSSTSMGSYYVLSTPGTYRVKAKLMNGSISTVESDEYVITITE